MLIGLDLDNTIIDYEAAFCSAAVDLEVIEANVQLGKTEVRDRIRALPDGERTWMGVQAHVYGNGIVAARLHDGVERFIAVARERGIPLVIVSHKSEFAAAAPAGPNLRESARRFLTEHGVDLNVHFESTRVEKCERIAALGVTHLVDDLIEVFEDASFPPGVVRWLFAPYGSPGGAHVDRVFRSWHELSDAISA